jgi:predicted amidophosphoribosyltransferase
MPGPVSDALRALAGLALPTSCAACGAGDYSVCRDCRSALAASLPRVGPQAATPSPRPAGLPPTVAAAAYLPPLSRLVPAYKDDGRRDLRPLLSALLGDALDTVLAYPHPARALALRNGPVLVIPVPTSRRARRRRGDAPLTELARTCVVGFGAAEVVCADALRMRRRVADQAGLSAMARQVNLEHSMEVRPAWTETVQGACCVLVDDVLTTGATLVEARRALARAGAADVLAATICATQRRHPPARRWPPVASPTGR